MNKNIGDGKESSNPYIEKLAKLGFSRAEALIYVYLLERGSQAGVSKIAIGAHMHRQQVYITLPLLLEAGIIEEVGDGKFAKYKARPPQYLERVARRKMVVAEDLAQELQKISKVGYEQESEIIVGQQGIVRHELDFLKEAEEGEWQYILGGNAQGFIDAMGDSYEEMLRLDRQKEIQTMYIGSTLDENAQKAHVGRRGNFQTKYLKKMPEGITHIVIRKDRVVFYSFLNPPTLHIMKSSVVAGNFKQFFMMLWEMADGR